MQSKQRVRSEQQLLLHGRLVIRAPADSVVEIFVRIDITLTKSVFVDMSEKKEKKKNDRKNREIIKKNHDEKNTVLARVDAIVLNAFARVLDLVGDII